MDDRLVGNVDVPALGGPRLWLHRPLIRVGSTVETPAWTAPATATSILPSSANRAGSGAAHLPRRMELLVYGEEGAAS
jgi:hypothetical protein